ncbi:hypothetical protein V8G54_025469 [Vigna mungo]|uniref:Uncharacterized protein n=1 Tax=Vigna mungo TaxID=3915 RepID=A0AAQ3MWZ9_VIGMU
MIKTTQWVFVLDCHLDIVVVLESLKHVVFYGEIPRATRRVLCFRHWLCLHFRVLSATCEHSRGFSSRCRAFESIILKSNGFGHRGSSNTQTKLRPNNIDLCTHLVQIPGGANGSLQVRHGGPHHRRPISHLRRKVAGVDENGAVCGDQNLAVLEPHKHLPPLHLLISHVR